MVRIDRRLMLYGTGLIVLLPLLFYGSYRLVSAVVGPTGGGEPSPAPDPLAALTADVVPAEIEPEGDPLVLPPGFGGSDQPTPVQQPFVPGSLADLPANATACQRVVVAALMARGAPYSQGGYMKDKDPVENGQYLPRNGPRSFDCSGMVWWSYQHAGIPLGWVAAQQANNGAYIPCTLDDLRGTQTTCWQPGDLLFLNKPGGAVGDHVAMYIRDGLFMNCANHQIGCGLHDVSSLASYRQNFWQARRIIGDCKAETVLTGAPAPLPSTTNAPAPSATTTTTPDHPTLRLGDTSDDVRMLQQLLNRWLAALPRTRIEPLAEDGVFDHITEAVVRSFQESTGLTGDGVVDQATWERLLDILDPNELPIVAESGELLAGDGAVAHTKPSQDADIAHHLDGGTAYQTDGYTDQGQLVEESTRWYRLQGGAWVHSSGGTYQTSGEQRYGDEQASPSPDGETPDLRGAPDAVQPSPSPDDEAQPDSSKDGESEGDLSENTDASEHGTTSKNDAAPSASSAPENDALEDSDATDGGVAYP